MSDHLSRRQILAGLLVGLAQTSGTVLLARSVLSSAAAEAKQVDAETDTQEGLQERADKIASENPLGEEEFHEVSFVNGGFRNGGGGFVNGGFHNGGGGGFRNGGFANGGGGFRKGGFANGGGGFRNGGFANGGGGGFRKGAFRNF